MLLANPKLFYALIHKSKEFLKSVASYRTLYNTMNAEAPNKLALIDTIHRQIDGFTDDFFSNPNQDKPSCSKGCSFCCSLYTLVSYNEAKLLAHAIKEKNIKIDMDLLKTQATVKKPEHWLLLPAKQRRCVFLKDSLCSVYDFRPASCRTYHVTSPPAQCNRDTNPNAGVDLVFDLHSEAFAEALRQKEGSGSLPQMLLAELNRNK